MRWLLAPALLLGACSGDRGAAPRSDATAPPADADRPGTPSDARSPEPDAARVECPPGLPEGFGDLGAVTSNKNDVGGHYNVFIDLAGDPRWSFSIYLYPGRGIFADGVAPGTYFLEGDDADAQYCAACLNLFADQPDDPASLRLFTLKGTLTIDSVVGEEVSGSLDDVLLGAIDIVYDDQGVACTPREDGEIGNLPECVNTICLNGHCGRPVRLSGCETSIEHLRF